MMKSYLFIYIELNVFCSALIMMLFIHSFRGFGAATVKRRFDPAMISLIIFFLSDTAWYAMDQGALARNLFLSMLLKNIYFLSASSNGYFWAGLFETVLKNRMMESKKNLLLFSFPFFFHLLLCLINVKTHFLFYIDESFTYHRGPLFILQYVIIYAYIMVPCIHALVLSFRRENYVEREKYLLIAFFPVLPAIGGLLQLFLWRTPINCVALTLSSSMIYLDSLTQQISLDPLTGLNNKRCFMKTVEQYIQNKTKEDSVYLLILDMNRFKQINDTHGHIEGDHAICAVADIIKASANDMLKAHLSETRKKLIIARYGGDEFVIGMVAAQEDVLYLKKQIHENFKEYNQSSGKPYQLSTSIGIAKWKSSFSSLKQLIEAADQELYKEKQAFRRK